MSVRIEVRDKSGNEIASKGLYPGQRGYFDIRPFPDNPNGIIRKQGFGPGAQAKGSPAIKTGEGYGVRY